MTNKRSIVLAVLIIALFMTASCEKINRSREGSFEGCFTSGTLSQAEALRYLRILVKGDHDSIGFYKKYKRTNDRSGVSAWTTYQNDICVTVNALSDERNTDAYDLILKVIKLKVDYPEATVCAIRTIMLYGDIKSEKWHGDKRSIPALKKLVNNEHPDISLYAAGSLLSLGEADIALPVLEDYAKEGGPQSIPALNLLFSPEQQALRGTIRTVLSDTRLFDERGEDILIDALDYSSDKVKLFAASRLLNMGVEEKRAEETVISVLNRLGDKKRTDYKKVEAWDKDRNSIFRAIVLLEKVNSKAGIDSLKKYADNTDDKLLEKRARNVLEAIQKK